MRVASRLVAFQSLLCLTLLNHVGHCKHPRSFPSRFQTTILYAIVTTKYTCYMPHPSYAISDLS